VLAQLVKHDKMKQADFDRLKTRPLGLDFERQNEDLGSAPHLTQQLRRWLISWADQNGYNIFADGLVVHTTIDSRLQKLATEALARQADKLQVFANNAWGKRMGANRALLDAFTRESAQFREAREAGLDDAEALKRVQSDTEFMQTLWRDKTTLQAAFLATDPTNGHVRAWVGSRDFRKDQFDHVQQARRQPGSTFKAFVYGAAFEQGISAQTTFVDGPVEIRIDERKVWRPTDMHDATHAPMTLRDGLVLSKNTITAQLMQQVGPSRVAKVAYDMGVRESKMDAVPSLALGTSPVTLKEMVSAYGTIANNGNYVEPFLVTRVENRKQVLEHFQPKGSQQGLSTAAAQTLLDVLRGVVDKGTGIGIRARFGIQGDLAGKTGTTQDFTDGWFILMHPNLVSGAWVGFNDNRITMQEEWGQGSRNALNIVGDFFQQALKTKVVNQNAVFAAPKEQNMLDRMNDWLNSVFQTPPPEEQPPVAEVPPLPSEPAIVAVPSPSPSPSPSMSPSASDLIQAPPVQRWPSNEPREYVPREYAPREYERPPQVVVVPPLQPLQPSSPSTSPPSPPSPQGYRILPSSPSANSLGAPPAQRTPVESGSSSSPIIIERER